MLVQHIQDLYISGVYKQMKNAFTCFTIYLHLLESCKSICMSHFCVENACVPLGCNDFTHLTPYRYNATLNPVCYVTNTSSVVEITCPEGFVFENTFTKTQAVECVCAANTGYPAINQNCIDGMLHKFN